MGQPPHVGWWYCVNRLRPTSEKRWRWWNGANWSVVCSKHEQFVDHWANKLTTFPDEYIAWSNYWPKNARVQRVKPNNES